MARRRAKIEPRREKKEAGQGLFNVYMGYSGTKGYLSQFKNPKSTNSVSTYNPFRAMADAAGADDF